MVHILLVVPATLVLKNDYSVRCADCKSYLRSTMGQRISNIVSINFEKACANLRSTMTWIASLISSAVKIQRQLFLLTCFMRSYENIFTSYIGQLY